jgi:hypothetical protein
MTQQGVAYREAIQDPLMLNGFLSPYIAHPNLDHSSTGNPQNALSDLEEKWGKVS